MTEFVSVAEARYLGKKHKIDRLVIFQLLDDGRFAITSYGKDKKTCDALRRWVCDASRTDEIAEQIASAK